MTEQDRGEPSGETLGGELVRVAPGSMIDRRTAFQILVTIRYRGCRS